MTQAEAKQLVTVLAAAFPWPEPPAATLRLFTAELTKLNDPQAATQAIEDIARSNERFPTLKRVLDSYREYARRAADQRARERGLAEPEAGPMPPEARAAVEAFLGKNMEEVLKTI